MEDSDIEPFSTYSLKSQFVLLQKVVLQSQPQLYGQMSMGNEPVGNFQVRRAVARFGNRATPGPIQAHSLVSTTVLPMHRATRASARARVSDTRSTLVTNSRRARSTRATSSWPC